MEPLGINFQREYRESAKVGLYVAIGLFVIGLILAITTTGGAKWRIGISAVMGTLTLAALALSLRYYLKSRNAPIVQAPNADEEIGRKLAFLMIVKVGRTRAVQSLESDMYKRLLKMADASYVDSGTHTMLAPPEGLLRDLQARDDWATLAREVGVSKTLIQAITQA